MSFWCNYYILFSKRAEKFKRSLSRTKTLNVSLTLWVLLKKNVNLLNISLSFEDFLFEETIWIIHITFYHNRANVRSFASKTFSNKSIILEKNKYFIYLFFYFPYFNLAISLFQSCNLLIAILQSLKICIVKYKIVMEN